MNSDQILEEFRLWCKVNKQKLKGKPVFAKVRRAEVEDELMTPPLYKAGIDLKSADILASFAVWGTGDISVIIMDNHTAKELVIDDRILQTPSEMHHLLDHYAELILSGGPFEKAP